MGASESRLAEGSGLQQQNHVSVFVVGPSSSGKTTLCNAVAKKLGLSPSHHIKEVARQVMKSQGFSRHTVKTYEMQHAIMLAQLEAEKMVLKTSFKNSSPIFMLSDRSAIDPIVYAATSGAADAEEMRQRLLDEPALQRTLPFYRQALFGKNCNFWSISYSFKAKFRSCTEPCRGMARRRWCTIVG